MIEVKDLTFSYGKEKQALHGLDFTVNDGEIFGFLGPNGSGKSTTQKILTGILTGHGGYVSLFGQKMGSSPTQDFFQNIGVLFEFPYLYTNLSAVDNLNYFASFYPKRQVRDVIAAGVAPGPEVGWVLNRLLKWVVNGEFPNDRDTLLQLLRPDDGPPVGM